MSISPNNIKEKNDLMKCPRMWTHKGLTFHLSGEKWVCMQGLCCNLLKKKQNIPSPSLPPSLPFELVLAGRSAQGGKRSKGGWMKEANTAFSLFPTCTSSVQGRPGLNFYPLPGRFRKLWENFFSALYIFTDRCMISQKKLSKVDQKIIELIIL